MLLANLRVVPRTAHTACMGVLTVERRGLAAAAESTPMMWKLAHGLFDPETSMSEKFPGVPDPVDAPAAAPTSVEVSTLQNGIRVASQDLGGLVSAVGLYVGSGSRHENPYSAGVSHLLEHLAFKGSSERSKYRMVRDMERTGALFAASAARETMAYTGEGLREKVPEMVDIISETATMPAVGVREPGSAEWDFAMDEIATQTHVIKDELKTFGQDGAGAVTEAVHASAFHGNSLGLPLIAEERKLNQLTPLTVADYVSGNYTPDRIVLSGANVDHASLVELAEKSLGSLSGASADSIVPARYTGGSVRIAADGPAHVAIGFQGVSWQDDDLVAACVLHTLLGGGGSFSSGGPGKGMYTRLYSEVLNRHAWVSSAIAFNHCYADAGLFGIHASCDDPAHVNNLVEVIGSQVGKLAGTLGAGELDRAKAMTTSSLIMNLESRAVVCEDIGRQVLSSGKYVGPAELVKKIGAVTEDDIRRIASRMLATAPSVVLFGESYEAYDYQAIASSVKKQAQISS